MNYPNELAEKRLQELTARPVIKKSLTDKILSIDNIMQMKFPEMEWLIEKIIPLQGITIISGAPATFKTWLLMQMAIDITENNLFLKKFQCVKSKILIIDEENQLRLIQKRMKLLDLKNGQPIYYLSQEDFSALNVDLINEVITFCDENDISTIFIDSLVRVSNTDENSAQQMAQVFKGLKKFCKAGKTVIVTHHEGKGSKEQSSNNGTKLRGSSDILAAIDCHVSLRRSREDKRKIALEQLKLRNDEETEPFTIVVTRGDDDGTVKFEYSGALIDERVERTRILIFEIIKETKDGMSMKAISDKVRELIPIGEKSTNNILKTMIQKGEIMSKKGPKNTILCFPIGTEINAQSQITL